MFLYCDTGSFFLLGLLSPFIDPQSYEDDFCSIKPKNCIQKRKQCTVCLLLTLFNAFEV